MKKIGDALACVLTLINIIGTIVITILCLNHSSESNSEDEITMLLINIIPQLFCFILLIDFCIDEETVNCNNIDCSGYNSLNGLNGNDLGPVGAIIAIICLFLFAVCLIIGFFYGLTKGIGKIVSRWCALSTIFFFETIISIYCIYLNFIDDDGVKYAYIFGVSLGLSIINFVGLLIPCCGNCLSFCSSCYSSCCSCCLSCSKSQRKSIINQPLVKKNNISEEKNDLLGSDFDNNPILINLSSDNSSEGNNKNFSIYNNNKDNSAIDSITKPNIDFDNDIQRGESNNEYSPLPYDFPNKNKLLENYKKNNNNNNN